MKIFSRTILSILLFFAFLTPIFAKNESQKVYHDNSSYLQIYDAVDGKDFYFGIDKANEDPLIYRLHYYMSYQTSTSYSSELFTAEIPSFPFSGAMDTDLFLSLCVIGEEQGYTYNIDDGSMISYIIPDSQKCLDVTLVFQSQHLSSFLNHERSTDLGKSIFKSRSASYDFLAEGTIAGFTLNGSYTQIYQSTTTYIYPQSNEMIMRFLAQISQVGSPLHFKSNGYSLDAFNEMMDSSENPIRYISVNDNDPKDGIIQITMESLLFNDIGESIGSTEFTASVPTSALVIANDETSATLDFHAYGLSIDRIYDFEVKADDPDPDPEPVPYEDDHMIHLVWELSFQSTNRIISRNVYVDGRTMGISLYSRYAGLTSGHIDDIEVDQWIGTMMSMRDHTKYYPVE